VNALDHFFDMSSVMYRREGPFRWDSRHPEQFPPDIAAPLTPTVRKTKQKQLAKGISHSAISADGSKAVIATHDRFVVYQIRSDGTTTPISVNIPPKSNRIKNGKIKNDKSKNDQTMNDEIKGVDISGGLLTLATVDRLILVLFNNGEREVTQSDVITLSLKRQGWSPTCVMLSHHQGASWCWVAVGGTLEVNLYLFRYINNRWTLQRDRPILHGCASEMRALAASENLTDNPYASLFAGACDNKLAFWNLRLWDGRTAKLSPVDTINVPAEDSVVPGRRITSLTIFFSPCGFPYILATMLPATAPFENKYQIPNWTFIMPVLHTHSGALNNVAPWPRTHDEAEPQTRWNHHCDLIFKSGDEVVSGHATSNQPYFAIVKNGKVKLRLLTGEMGKLGSSPVNIGFEHKLKIHRDNYRAASIQLVNSTDELRILTIDQAGTLVVYTLIIPGLPGPPTPPTPLVESDSRELDHEIDGIQILEVHGRSSADTHPRSSTSAASGFTLITQPSSQSGSPGNT
jgi:hypothetical protein